MKAVPGYSHLVRRGAVYWLRRRVPSDLVSHLPFAEWKETLGTKDLEEAKRLLRLRLVKIDNEIAVARAKVEGATVPPLTRQEAVQIATSRLAEWLNDDEEARLEQGEAAFDNVEAWLEAEGEDPSRALAAGRWQVAERNAEWALDQVGRWYPKGDPSVRLLANELLKARVQFIDMVIQRQGGEVVTAPVVPAALEPARPSLAATGITLGALIAQYRAAREVEHGAESTTRKYGHIFKALEEVLGGDRVVATVTKEDARAVRKLLTEVPASAGKRFPGLTLTEAADAARAKGAQLMAPNTVNTYLQNLAAVFNWAVEEGHIEKNPARGLTLKSKASVKRRGFHAPELATLFNNLAPFREEVPSRFWVPALGLYLGARLNELCQLTASDVGEEDGIAFVNFSEFDVDTGERVANRSVKTEASDRRVPIHAELIAAGFLDFVQAVRDAGGGRLFPECALGPDGRYSHGFSKWFARTLDLVGLTAKSLVFHSFRHGFQDACREAQIREEVTDALGGWVSLRIAAGYGNRARLTLLAKESAKVGFGEFSLTNTVSTVPATAGHRIAKASTPATKES